MLQSSPSDGLEFMLHMCHLTALMGGQVFTKTTEGAIIRMLMNLGPQLAVALTSPSSTASASGS